VLVLYLTAETRRAQSFSLVFSAFSALSAMKLGSGLCYMAQPRFAPLQVKRVAICFLSGYSDVNVQV
jgi:hypothetical protein